MVLLRCWRAFFNDRGTARTKNLIGEFGVVDGAREHESANAQRHRRNRAVSIDMLANQVDQAAQTLLEYRARWAADAGDLRGEHRHGTSLLGIVAMGLAEVGRGEFTDPVGTAQVREVL